MSTFSPVITIKGPPPADRPEMTTFVLYTVYIGEGGIFPVTLPMLWMKEIKSIQQFKKEPIEPPRRRLRVLLWM